LLLYRDGRTRGLSTGWKSLDEYMTIRPGELSVVTGVPGSGKSEFIDALAVNLAHSHDWRFAICSFENPPRRTHRQARREILRSAVLGRSDPAHVGDGFTPGNRLDRGPLFPDQVR